MGAHLRGLLDGLRPGLLRRAHNVDKNYHRQVSFFAGQHWSGNPTRASGGSTSECTHPRRTPCALRICYRKSRAERRMPYHSPHALFPLFWCGRMLLTLMSSQTPRHPCPPLSSDIYLSTTTSRDISFIDVVRQFVYMSAGEVVPGTLSKVRQRMSSAQQRLPSTCLVRARLKCHVSSSLASHKVASWMVWFHPVALLSTLLLLLPVSARSEHPLHRL